MSMIDGLIGKLLTKGRVELIWADGSRSTFGPGDGHDLTVRLHDRRVAFDIARNPKLAFAEAYIEGRLTIERGTILQLFEMTLGQNRWEDGGGGRKALSRASAMFRPRWRRNSPTKSRRNVAHHYDLSSKLYSLFLDKDLQYSCAYYIDPANSLERAQADKKAHIAAKLYLKPGQRVLDIGCGWGGTALYLHRVADVDVLGITLSEEQLKVARRRAEEAGVADRVRFELVDYRRVEGNFDRIVSIGMFEHVGAAHYDEFFATCRELLAPDGVMLLHTIGRLGGAAAVPDPFTDKYIFPGYHVPSLAQMGSSSEKARMIVADVEILRLHYAFTLRQWLDRAIAARAEIVALYDERFFRLWEFYLAGAIFMFETGAGCNYQVQYIRDRHALPLTRDYLAEGEARYRAMGDGSAF